MNVYVDDPLVILRGTFLQRNRITALIILAWRILGVNLAYTKAQCNDTIDWIGWNLAGSTLHKTVTCNVRSDRLDELFELALRHVKANVISIKDLRTFVGKAQSMASLLYSWRPFLSMLWAAIYSVQSNAPAG